MKKANPLAIGIFVITAIFLLFAGIIVLGAGKFFQKTREYICFFDETVNGLDVGAPVKYKGVTLGKINKIYISTSEKTKKQEVMVIFSLIENGGVVYSKDKDTAVSLDDTIDQTIVRGLRSKLAYQSIVTGMLYIELDYFAKEGDAIEYNYNGSDYTEIPSMSSNAIEEFSKKIFKIADDIADMQLDQIGQNLNKTLITLNTKIDAIDTKSINEKTVKLLDEVNAVIAEGTVKHSIEKLNKVLESADALILSAKTDLNALSVNMGSTLDKGDKFLENMNAFTSRYSPFMTEFSMLLNTLKTTSASAQSLMEYLERNPSALLKGKASKDNK